MLARMTSPGDPQDRSDPPRTEPAALAAGGDDLVEEVPDGDLVDDGADDELVAALAALEREARERLRAGVGELRGPAPAGLGAAAAGARESAIRGEWPLDWVARAAGGTLPEGDADLLLALLEALVAPTEPTGLDDEDEALLLAIGPHDWADVAVALWQAGAGAPAHPEALAGLVGEAGEGDREVLAAGFALVEPVLTACGVSDLEGRLTALGAWLLPRAVDRALEPA